MTVDVITLVALIYEAGGSLVEQCRLVKQHPAESSRIAMRVLNVLAVLQNARKEFEGSDELKTSLIELRDLLEKVTELFNNAQSRWTLSY